MSESNYSNIKTTVVMLAWASVLAVGMTMLHAHGARPGDPGSRRGRWPIDSTISRVADWPIILVFLDPRCPCARATIAELEIILASSGNQAMTRIVLVGSPEQGAAWVDDGTWANLVKLPGVELLRDDQGLEAKRFGVATSGQVLVFHHDGELVFQGGITPSRGHQGANYGREAVIGLILGEKVSVSSFPVFGCPLEKGVGIGERTP